VGIRQWLFPQMAGNTKEPSAQYETQDLASESPIRSDLEYGTAPRRITRQWRLGLSGWSSLMQHGYPSTNNTSYLPPIVSPPYKERLRTLFGKDGVTQGGMANIKGDYGVPSVFIPVEGKQK